MGKYIITFEDYPQMEEDGVKFYSCNEAPWWYASEQIISKLTPYTEPDLDAIRNEAYEKGVQDTKQHWVDAPRSCAYRVGYEEGLNDAWDAARKIFEYNATTLNKIFSKCCYSVVRDILRKYSASEVIEKIRQWEDMKILKPGNEVVSTQGVGIVTKVTRTGVELFHKDGSTGYDKFEAVKKTGRHFPEFVELLAKMKGESNDPD